MDRYNKDNSIKLVTNNNINYYKTKKYPKIPLYEDDIYIITVNGDRLDLIAYYYYNDASLWWVISFINENTNKGSMFPIPGTQLRIPLNINNILSIYNDINK